MATPRAPRSALGPGIKLGVRNARAVIGRVYKYHLESQRGIQGVVEKWAPRLVRAVQRHHFNQSFHRPIWQTGLMHDEVKAEISRDGFALTVGWDPADIIGKTRTYMDERTGRMRTEIVKRFYPVDVVFGTSRMPARDPLKPALEETTPGFKADLSAELRLAAQRMRARRAGGE